VLLEKYGIVGGAGKDGIWYSVRANSMGKTMPEDFAPSRVASNYAKLASVPVWFTFACWRHKQLPNGQWIVDPDHQFEDPMPSDATLLNKFSSYGGLTHHMHSSPIVADISGLGTVVICWGENGNLREWRANPDGSLTFLGNGQEIASPEAKQPPLGAGGMTGGEMALSSNGQNDAISWALVPRGDANKELTQGDLIAYDVHNLAKYPDGSGWVKTLVKIPMGLHPKFDVPIVTSGIVLVPTYNHTVDAYSVN